MHLAALYARRPRDAGSSTFCPCAQEIKACTAHYLVATLDKIVGARPSKQGRRTGVTARGKYAATSAQTPWLHLASRPALSSVGARRATTLSPPPRLQVGTEVGLCPGREVDLVIRHRGVRQGKGEGSWPAHHLPVRVVLRPVARADVPVRTSYPGHDAAEVCADRVHAEVLHAVFRGHEPRGLALQPLHKLAVAFLVGRQPTLDADRLSLFVLGGRAATADWEEVQGIRSHDDHGVHKHGAHGAHNDEVHQVP